MLAIGLFMVATGFDYGSVVRASNIYGLVVSPYLFVDGKWLCDCVTGIKSTAVKRMCVYFEAIRDEYELRKIIIAKRFSSGDSQTNALTKSVLSNLLQKDHEVSQDRAQS